MLYIQGWNYNPVSKLLLKAADLLEKHGHVKHIRLDATGSMCFLGALEKAEFGDSDLDRYADGPLTFAASKAVAEVLGSDVSTPIIADDYRGVMAIWNNDPVRTGQQVIDAMRKTAEVVEKENNDAQ